MSSSISHFRPWILALIAVAGIELAYWSAVKPPRLSWNGFLDFQFAQTESFQRLVTHDKIIAFETADPDIIQVGDSSGLHGVQPPVVMSHIPGWRYLNLSVATNLGYPGYYNLARLQLERSPNARYLVLYASPFGGLPRQYLWDGDQKLMAPLIHKEFVSPWYRLVQLPTLAARREVINNIYYLGYRFKQDDSPLSENRGYLAFREIFQVSNGWTRETDVERDVPANIYNAILPGLDMNQLADPELVRQRLRGSPRLTDELFFDWRTLSHSSYFDLVYGAFAELAKKHGVKLVVVFNPVPESARGTGFDDYIDWAGIKSGLEKVQKKYPDIIFSGIDFWPDPKFSVFSHISTLHAEESSHRVGHIMHQVIGQERPPARTTQKQKLAATDSVIIHFDEPYCGYGFTDAVGDTHRFPLQHVGARGRGWVWTAVEPGVSHRARLFYKSPIADTGKHIDLHVNGVRAKKVDSGDDSTSRFVEYMVPAESVSGYGGWIKLEFGPGLEPSGLQRQTVTFQRLVMWRER